MALGDEEFYTLDGQKVDRDVLVQIMIDFFNEKYLDTNITDFNEGSEIRNILEAIAVDVFHMELNDQSILTASFLATSYGSYLDLFGEELNTPRQTGMVSWGEVTFSIESPVNYLITIPAGTVLVSQETGLYYETNMTVEIPIGETSVDCPCYSQVPGAGTNAEADTITMFREQNYLPEVSITNASAFTGGRDTESDDDYRQRLLDVKNQDGFGSREYYNRIGTNVSGVHDITIINSASYTGKVLVNGYTKPLPSDVLTNVTAVYTDEQNLVYNQTFEVAEVEYTTVDLEITAVVTDEIQDSIFEDLLALFFNGGSEVINNNPTTYGGLSINQAVTSYMLLTVLESLSFVVQITSITSNGETYSKITPDSNKALKLGEIQITQEIAE